MLAEDERKFCKNMIVLFDIITSQMPPKEATLITWNGRECDRKYDFSCTVNKNLPVLDENNSPLK